MVSSIDQLLKSDGIVVVYDGECPFCTNYVRLVRLKETAGPVQLVNARERPDIVANTKMLGYDLDEGMLVLFRGKIHAGDAAMTVLSALSSRSGTLNRLFAWLFSSSKRASALYPSLRLGRNVTLKLLGRSQLS